MKTSTSTNNTKRRKKKKIKKRCFFKQSHIDFIDYKDVETLEKFIMLNGKIMPRYYSGVSAKNQRKLAKAIKKAREVGFLSPIDKREIDKRE